MPGFDQRGPMGRGPMTGRRMGRCTDFGEKDKGLASSPGNDTGLIEANDFRGAGRRFGLRGHGRGRGLGRQNRFRGGWD